MTPTLGLVQHSDRLREFLRDHVERHPECNCKVFSVIPGAVDALTAAAARESELRAEVERLRGALRELVACRNESDAVSAALDDIPYTATDIELDRARSGVPDELRARISAIGPRFAAAWETASAALAEELDNQNGNRDATV